MPGSAMAALAWLAMTVPLASGARTRLVKRRTLVVSMAMLGTAQVMVVPARTPPSRGVVDNRLTSTTSLTATPVAVRSPMLRTAMFQRSRSPGSTTPPLSSTTVFCTCSAG